MIIWAPKDPDETARRSVDWSPRLGCDHVSSASFEVIEGTVSVESSENDCTFSNVLISGGADGERAKILCSVTTRTGQTLEETAVMLVKAR